MSKSSIDDKRRSICYHSLVRTRSIPRRCHDCCFLNMSKPSNQDEDQHTEERAGRRNSSSQQSHSSENTVNSSDDHGSTAEIYPQRIDISETDDPKSESWNQSGTNVLRTLATFWSFALMGANDAAEGVSFVSAMFKMDP